MYGVLSISLACILLPINVPRRVASFGGKHTLIFAAWSMTQGLGMVSLDGSAILLKVILAFYCLQLVLLCVEHPSSLCTSCAYLEVGIRTHNVLFLGKTLQAILALSGDV